jgi:protein phosphatase
MGGHNGGELASQWTIEVILSEIAAITATTPDVILGHSLQAANDEIRRMAQDNANLYGMGTTIVAATVEGEIMKVANVGDSRLYVANPKRKTFRQVTRDHSLVEEMVRRGQMAKELARNHPDKHVITRAVGAKDIVEIDFFHEMLKMGELALLCSDGLSNMLEDEEISQILFGEESIDKKAKELIKAANDKGGKDNIAVVIVARGS